MTEKVTGIFCLESRKFLLKIKKYSEKIGNFLAQIYDPQISNQIDAAGDR